MGESEAIAHIMTHHVDADGWIALARKDDGEFRQCHYHLSEIEEVLSEWSGHDNLYFSQNTFFVPYRRIDTIRQLRSMYVDVDCYNRGLDPIWVLGKLELEAFRRTVPDPNMVIFSGRGLVLVWHIEPVPYMALPLWQAVQKHLFQSINALDVGADSKSLDAARIFRIAGSFNSKNGQVVHVEFRHSYRYELRDIQYEYLPELPQKKRVEKKRPQKQSRQVETIFNTHTLHYNRLLDLNKLVELRNGDVEGHRELMCFLYRYWSCCFNSDSADALTQTLEFNKTFRKPLSDKEVERSTKSAEKAWQARYDDGMNEVARLSGYKYAGYNLTNEKLIEQLGISPEEQQHLNTIIGTDEKYRRKNVKREQERREHGIPTRDEYLNGQKQQTEDKMLILAEALRINPDAKRTELAELLGVSPSRISQLRKQLGM